MLLGRSGDECFSQSNKCHIGLASSTIKAGDYICIVLECPNSLCLRPDASEKSKVVAECNVHGMMDNAPFIGLLLKNWWRVIQYSPHAHFWLKTSVNDATSRIREEDPRLSAMLYHRDGVLQVTYIKKMSCYCWMTTREIPKSSVGVDLHGLRLRVVKLTDLDEDVT